MRSLLIIFAFCAFSPAYSSDPVVKIEKKDFWCITSHTHHSVPGKGSLAYGGSHTVSTSSSLLGMIISGKITLKSNGFLNVEKTDDSTTKKEFKLTKTSPHWAVDPGVYHATSTHFGKLEWTLTGFPGPLTTSSTDTDGGSCHVSKPPVEDPNCPETPEGDGDGSGSLDGFPIDEDPTTTSCEESPIVIDLAQDGIHLGAKGVGVYFDIRGNGQETYIQWVREGGDEAFLARDLNGNGVIDDGSELFGNHTRLESGEKAPNGFVALAQYDRPEFDGNNDGYINAADEIYSELVLWLDDDADGVCTPGEIYSLEEMQLTRLEIIPKSKRHYDKAGNYLAFWAEAYNDHARRSKHTMLDVFFKVL